MFPEPHRISTEWAVQLAYLMKFKLDYSTLHVMHSNRVDKCLVSLWWKIDNGLDHMTPIAERLPELAVELDQKVYDPINEEITLMGYNSTENVLVVGCTIKYPHKGVF